MVIVIFFFLFGSVQLASAEEVRSHTALRHFAKANPCPANSQRITHCPGYVIDHVVPLCAGGKDAPENMQWQEYKESLLKDKTERELCAYMRKHKQ